MMYMWMIQYFLGRMKKRLRHAIKQKRSQSQVNKKSYILLFMKIMELICVSPSCLPKLNTLGYLTIRSGVSFFP